MCAQGVCCEKSDMHFGASQQRSLERKVRRQFAHHAKKNSRSAPTTKRPSLLVVVLPSSHRENVSNVTSLSEQPTFLAPYPPTEKRNRKGERREERGSVAGKSPGGRSEGSQAETPRSRAADSLSGFPVFPTPIRPGRRPRRRQQRQQRYERDNSAGGRGRGKWRRRQVGLWSGGITFILCSWGRFRREHKGIR